MASEITDRLLAAKNSSKQVEKIVSRLARLAPEVAAAKMILKEYEELKDALAALANRDFDAKEIVTFTTMKVQIEYSQRDMVRTVRNNEDLYKHLGHDVFVANAHISMRRLDDLLSDAAKKRLIARKRVGSRTFKIKTL